MFRFDPGIPGGNDQPWFRLGTWPVGTAGVVALVIVASMFVWALEGPGRPVSEALAFSTAQVQRGQVWRVLTWWIPNAPGLGAIIDAVVIGYFGTQIEGALGRDRMLRYLAALVAIPPILLTLIDFAFDLPEAVAGASPLGRAIFISFVLYLPAVRFFFGIPAWVFAVVFVGLDFLSAIGFRDTAYLVFLIVSVGSTLLLAKAFGLANEVTWIPLLPLPSFLTGAGRPPSGGGVTRPRRSRSKAKLEVVNPLEEQLEQMEIDEILDQIGERGMDSLSREQRKKLENHSKKQRKRRGES